MYLGLGCHLGGKAGPPPGTLGDSALDDLGLCHQHIHEIPPAHKVEEEVQVVLVLKAGILSDAERVGGVAGDGLLTEDVLGALHHCRLAHALQGIGSVCGFLCNMSATHLSMTGRAMLRVQVCFPSWRCVVQSVEAHAPWSRRIEQEGDKKEPTHNRESASTASMPTCMAASMCKLCCVTSLQNNPFQSCCSDMLYSGCYCPLAHFQVFPSVQFRRHAAKAVQQSLFPYKSKHAAPFTL